MNAGRTCRTCTHPEHPRSEIEVLPLGRVDHLGLFCFGCAICGQTAIKSLGRIA